jgi:predicted transcriptional regulator YheO
MTKDEEGQFLETLSMVAQAISAMFGPNCEVCISDLDHPEDGILYIYNGHVTERQPGGPLIAEARERVSKTGGQLYLNYRKTIRPGGPFIKSCTVVRQVGSRSISFCINYDCSRMQALAKSLDGFLETTSRQEDMDILGINEPDKLGRIIANTIQAQGRPAGEFKKADRVAVVRALDEGGIMELPGAVRLVADALGMSRYSVYNYLKEVRAEQ